MASVGACFHDTLSYLSTAHSPVGESGEIVRPGDRAGIHGVPCGPRGPSAEGENTMWKTVLALAIGAWVLLDLGAALAAGDTAAGKTKSALCVACHGPDGNSANPEWPKLAGQQAEYIVKQLKDFKSGARQNPLMTGIAAGLSETDMENLAAYFSSQKVKAVGITDAELAKRGERLYRGGSRKMQVSACMACHGPAGQGVPPRFPSVSGQHATYSEIQLQAFKEGKRRNEIMRAIAARMSKDEIKAVAVYMSGLEPAR